jgi:hypothetical protein
VRRRRVHLYVALAVAAALGYGIWVGPDWMTDAVVLAVAAIAVTRASSIVGDADSLLRILTFGLAKGYRQRSAGTEVTEHGQRERMLRSRVMHYITLSRIKSTASIARESDSPFERALLGQPGWRMLSGESLEEIARRAPDALVKSAQ